MIQRIQSVWLLLTSVCVFAGLKLPFYSGTNKEGVPSSLLNGMSPIYLLLLTVAISVISLVTIFLYKNRNLQLRLCLITILLQVGLIYLYYHQSTFYTGGTFALTAILQPAALLFLFFAVTGIRKDNKMVKDSDRLR
ncbi:MAG: DUF4293 domain-containing protein [Bacteroidetes bacterium]|nr:DUF4293 domain-containing protein [Bacteroidota bacterium]MBS1757415.1 DUF4293 domain-containing protein [Bacteroidota bacterium]